MALIPTVAKKSVTEIMNKMWSIILNLSVTDGEMEIINKDFLLKYRSGQNIEIKVKEILEKMQEAINDYKSEQIIFNHVKLDDAIIYLNNNLTG